MHGLRCFLKEAMLPSRSKQCVRSSKLSKTLYSPALCDGDIHHPTSIIMQCSFVQTEMPQQHSGNFHCSKVEVHPGAQTKTWKWEDNKKWSSCLFLEGAAWVTTRTCYQAWNLQTWGPMMKGTSPIDSDWWTRNHGPRISMRTSRRRIRNRSLKISAKSFDVNNWIYITITWRQHINTRCSMYGKVQITVWSQFYSNHLKSK